MQASDLLDEWLASDPQGSREVRQWAHARISELELRSDEMHAELLRQCERLMNARRGKRLDDLGRIAKIVSDYESVRWPSDVHSDDTKLAVLTGFGGLCGRGLLKPDRK